MGFFRKFDRKVLLFAADSQLNNLCYNALKRLFDVVFSVVVVALCLVPGIILGIFVACDTKGFPLYTQIRAGKNGMPFRIFKFRSMVADSDHIEKYLTAEQIEQWNTERKVDNDPRITPLGGFLRMTSLDEIPQFFNVIAGQMSIVGPRAIAFDELEWFGDQKDVLLSVRPGITGAWQTGPRNEARYETGERQRIELEYVRTASLAKDLRYFFKTFAVLLKRTGQ